jgi:membrane associated rhomboid family serine protease
MQPQFPPITPTVRTLLVVLVVFFLGQTMAEGMLGIPLTGWAALGPGLHFELAWQWATYWLVAVIGQPSDVFWHLTTLFALYWVLSLFEAEQGRARLLGLVAVAVISGALPVIVMSTLVPSVFGLLAGPSVLVFAWLAAFAAMRPGARVGVWIVAIPPISPWTMVAVTLVIELLQAAWTHNAVGIVSALGATAGGVLFARYLDRPKRSKPTPPKKKVGRPNLKLIEGGAEDDGKPRWLN